MTPVYITFDDISRKQKTKMGVAVLAALTKAAKVPSVIDERIAAALIFLQG